LLLFPHEKSPLAPSSDTAGASSLVSHWLINREYDHRALPRRCLGILCMGFLVSVVYVFPAQGFNFFGGDWR
ncbi:hypothetical protein VIGAN_02175300, partial [Vigna angularis var. angularis]